MSMIQILEQLDAAAARNRLLCCFGTNERGWKNDGQDEAQSTIRREPQPWERHHAKIGPTSMHAPWYLTGRCPPPQTVWQP